MDYLDYMAVRENPNIYEFERELNHEYLRD